MTTAMNAAHAVELREASDAYWKGAAAPPDVRPASATLTTKKPTLAPEIVAECDALDAKARKAEALAVEAEAKTEAARIAYTALHAESKLARQHADTARGAAKDRRKAETNKIEAARAAERSGAKLARAAEEKTALEAKIAKLQAELAKLQAPAVVAAAPAK